VVKVFDNVMRHLFLIFAYSVSAVLAQTNSGHAGGGGSSQLSPGNSMPMVIEKTEPEYTKEALDAKLEGFVALSITVSVDGVASDIQIVKGLGFGLDEKAVECLKKWRFSPATRNGEPIPAKAQVEIRFKLPN
jgi:TonB family protein